MIINTVINLLCEKQLITEIPFIITDELRLEYARTYALVANGEFESLKSSNRKYALKLAGLNLLHYSGITTSGFVYCISNPSFPGFIKVGITKDVKKRLSSYQTYDPHRAYKLETYRFVQDKKKTEKELLLKYGKFSDKGEWVTDPNVVSYVRTFS
jgi:hypothetical protein